MSMMDMWLLLNVLLMGCMMNMVVMLVLVMVWMGSDNVWGWWLQEWSPSIIIIIIVIIVVIVVFIIVIIIIVVSMVGSCQVMSRVLIGIVDMVMMMMIVMTRVGRHGSDMVRR